MTVWHIQYSLKLFYAHMSRAYLTQMINLKFDISLTSMNIFLLMYVHSSRFRSVSVAQ